MTWLNNMSQQYSESSGEQAVSEYVDALASELEAQAVEAQSEALGEMEASLGQMGESEQKELSELCTGIMTGRINLEQQAVTEQFLPAILGAAKFLLPKVLPIVKPIIMKQGGALAAKLFGRPGANMLFKTTTRRNVYPDFEVIRPTLQPTAAAQAQRLSQAIGISVPQDKILSAPWVGRLGEGHSGSTSQGWLRNESRFWSEFRRRWPSDYNKLGPGHVITPEFARKYGWPNSVVGDKLVHHHIENGPFVVPIPESFHRRLSGIIHARPTVYR